MQRHKKKVDIDDIDDYDRMGIIYVSPELKAEIDRVVTEYLKAMYKSILSE